MNTKSISRLAAFIILMTPFAACTEEGDVDLPEVNLDSAGVELGRGMEKAGNKLDTAFTGIKTEFNEAQIRNTLRRLNGMDEVDVELRKDGHVRLHGVVVSERERKFAEDVARNIKGVTSVTNDLTIGTLLDTVKIDPDTVKGDTVVRVSR